MQLPFTREQFFDLFAAYNSALWPAVLALWLASIVMAVRLGSDRRPSDRVVSALLAVHWAWSGLVYHIAFFTRINPAAWLFGALFLFQAGLFIWFGIVQDRLRFAPRRSSRGPFGWLLIGYGLLYPPINAAQHLTLLRIPAFAVPCPTTIYTAGLLMLTTARSWQLAVIPIVWAAIGGSAAFALGVPADYALPIAGIALAVSSFRRGHESRGPAPTIA
jgi:hypothetical protein